MPREFTFRDYRCALSAGYPVVGSVEQQTPLFVDQLAAAPGFPRRLSRKDLVSWILARLTELTYGGLPLEGNSFSSDGGEFGYRIKIVDSAGILAGYWGIIFWPERIQLCGHSPSNLDGQTLLVEMLTDSPNSLDKCEITVRNPDARTKKTFGWNGHQFV
jgi:hypothetical protein